MLRPAPAGSDVRICKKIEISDGGICTFLRDPIQGPAVQNRRPLYRICTKKVRIPPDVIPIFCISERLLRPGRDGAFSPYLFLHEIEKPPTLFSAATFTKDEMQAKKLLTFGVHLAMIQPTKTQ